MQKSTKKFPDIILCKKTIYKLNTFFRNEFGRRQRVRAVKSAVSMTSIVCKSHSCHSVVSLRKAVLIRSLYLPVLASRSK